MNAVFDARREGQAQSVLEWLKQSAPGADLRLDSRTVVAGDVFVACPGVTGDGRRHVSDALARGAGAVVFEADARGAWPDLAALDVPSLAVPGLRALLGELGDQWYGRPSQALTVIAVTGTNGKTSCANWIADALNRQGEPCAVIGTLGATLPDGQTLPGVLTTPDVLTVHRTLAQVRDAGAQVVAMEASSIGVEQGRLDGVRIGIAGFTNLTRDHLDYHGTMENYEQAKARLFYRDELRAAIVNADDAAGRRLLAALPAELCTAFALRAEAPIRATGIRESMHGLVFNLVLPEGEAQVVTRLPGEHNVSNMLLVAGVLRALGWPLSRIAGALSATVAVAGRLQTIDPVADSDGPAVVVDYAHTPDALARVSSALRPLAAARGGRLVCVFGCGGERDAGKRPEMGRVAAGAADRLVVTSDNPRGEDPRTIIGQILAGVPPEARLRVEVIAERADAVMRAVWSAAPEDVVLLAGKGHETYQETAGKREPFDDREWARLALLLPRVPGVSTDTRRIAQGELFLALAGENFDGHDYLARAQAGGACAAVVARRVADCGLPQIVLGDTRRALVRMGAAWRARHALPVIGVTGSNGKTTTKEMISAILAAWLGADARLATAGNFNNDIGVPLTLLRLRGTHRAAVVELGMNHPGEIAALAAMAAPTVALVNNAQREHQEFMHSVEAVARENGAVLAALPADGVAVYPGDDPHAAIWDELAGSRRRLRFGLDASCEVRAADLRPTADGTACTIHTPAGAAELALAVPGFHNVRNALAAMACALAAGAPLEAAVRGLAGFDAVKGRMQSRRLADGRILIDDTYNANPDSVRAAIDVLSALPAPRALVLGDMGEVGDDGPAMHREIGGYARERGIEMLYTLGPASELASAEFGAAARACASVEEIVAGLLQARPASVLVKGSRFMRMERVVAALADNNNSTEHGQGDRHAA